MDEQAVIQQQCETPEEEIRQQCETPDETNAAPVTKKKSDGLGTAFAIVCLVFHIIGVIVFLCGICRAFNKDLGILGAVEFFIGVFKIKLANIYETIAKLVLAIIYVVVFVFLVKNTVSIGLSLSKLKGEPKKGNEDKNTEANVKVKNSLKNQILNDIYRKTADGYFKMLLLIILAYVLSGNGLTYTGYITIALTGALYFVTCVLWTLRSKLPHLREKGVAAELILSIVRPIVFIFLFLFFGLVTMQPVGENLAFGLQAVFNGCFGAGAVGVITTLYDKIVLHILDAILICYYLSALNSVLNYDREDSVAKTYEHYRRLNRTAIQYMSVAIVSLVAAFILPLISLSTAGSILPSDVTRALLTALRSRFLAAVLISVAVWVICAVLKTD